MQETLTALFIGRNNREPTQNDLVEYAGQWWEYDDLLGKWKVKEGEGESPVLNELKKIQYGQMVALAIIVAVILFAVCGTHAPFVR